MSSPLCVVSGQVLANDSMVPTKMNRHFTTNHPSLQSKIIDYFKRLLQSNAKERKIFKNAVTVSDKAQLASYHVAESIALKSKSHILAESVILPASKKTFKVIFNVVPNNFYYD